MPLAAAPSPQRSNAFRRSLQAVITAMNALDLDPAELADLQDAVTDLETQATDFETRIAALESA